MQPFVAPSLPIRVDQAVMPTPRGRRRPPTQGGAGLSRHKRFRGTMTGRCLASGGEAERRQDTVKEGREGGGVGTDLKSRDMPLSSPAATRSVQWYSVLKERIRGSSGSSTANSILAWRFCPIAARTKAMPRSGASRPNGNARPGVILQNGCMICLMRNIFMSPDIHYLRVRFIVDI